MKRRAAGRMSDTEALVARGFADGESHSISTRKVGEQWLTDTYRYNPKTGMSECSSVVSKNPPRIEPAKAVGSAGPGSVGNESLADTKRYMGKV